MHRVGFLILAGTLPLVSQIASQSAVTPVLAGGLSPRNWSIGDGGPAVDALLNPSALAWDRAGNLLIADNLNRRIRRMTPDGVISTLFNQGGIAYMAVDSKGNLYASAVDPNSFLGHIYEFSPAAVKTEIPNPDSSYYAPAIAIDAADNLYIADQLGGFVWKRSASGQMSIVVPPPVIMGPEVHATLTGPHALALDSSSNLMIADYDGILRLNPDGTLVRLFDGGGPSRIAPAADGTIYFSGVGYGIWRWSPSGGVVSFAGTPQTGFSDGCALSGGQRVAKYASMNPQDLLLDPSGRLYFADASERVRRIDPDGSIRTVAGTGSMPRESAPGGAALGAIFHNPGALAIDGSGNVFFAEASANHVHEITASGQFLTVAGADSPPAGEDPACYPAPGPNGLSSPGGIGVDGNGNLYIADGGHNRILRRSEDGTITTIAGTGVEGQSGDGGPAVQAEISAPTAIALKPDGSIYFVSDGLVRRIRTDGIIESPPAPPANWLAAGFDSRLVLSGAKLYKEGADGVFYALRSGVGMVAADPAGAIYGPASPLVRISPNCSVSYLTASAGLINPYPQGIVSDSAGNLFTSADNSVWRIPAIAPPAEDTPSISLDNPGVYNAASNLTAFTTPPSPCLKGCTPYAVNDSITGNEILHITGGCMGPLQPVQASFTGGRLPTSLQGTQVLFDGEPAPLVSVQATEILAIAPNDVASKSKVTLAVGNQGASASVVLNASPTVPGVYVSSGTQADAVNEDGSLNGPGHPASAGSIIALFLTGAGLTNPIVPDGMAPAAPLPPLALPVTVKVGGVDAAVLYAGAALGFAGLVQVNIRVPPVAASNAVPVLITIGGISRNQNVTIAVR